MSLPLLSRRARYKAGDSEAEEWGKSSFFYASPPSPSTSPSKNPTPEDDAGSAPSSPEGSAAAAAAATARARRSRRLLSGLHVVDSAPTAEGDEDVAAAPGAWGPDAVKVAVFGDMGTAEVDGSVREPADVVRWRAGGLAGLRGVLP